VVDAGARIPAGGDAHRLRTRDKLVASVPIRSTGHDRRMNGVPRALGPPFGAQSLLPRMTSTGRSQCSMSFLKTRPSSRERSPEIPCEPTTTTAAARSRAMSINVSATSTSSGTACGSATRPKSGRGRPRRRQRSRRARAGGDRPLRPSPDQAVAWSYRVRRAGPWIALRVQAPTPWRARPGARRRARQPAARRPERARSRRRRSGSVPPREPRWARAYSGSQRSRTGPPVDWSDTRPLLRWRCCRHEEAEPDARRLACRDAGRRLPRDWLDG
jgi:hypothetical protein